MIISLKATPHTRGSTFSRGAQSSPAGGYPAYAGIDPLVIDTLFDGRRLPRIRGDRPSIALRSGWSSWATPHTRGSTLYPYPFRSREPGYPAYAGIDLRKCNIIGVLVGLPRIRGDRPFHFACKNRQVPATPHTRGSTLSPRRLSFVERGYPAYAGIDHNRIWRVVEGYGLPRIRGDRPYSSMYSFILVGATPHTRGSTCRILRDRWCR